jgi:hypothetical protein
MKRFLVIIAMVLLAACDRDIHPIEQTILTPDLQDPAAWAEYTAALREYKSGDHNLVYARFDNAPGKAFSEKNFLRSLPDSLDIVAMVNPLSEFDREDLTVVRSKGTRVLLQADCSDLATAAAKVDEALAAIAADGLDGIVISYNGAADAGAQTASAAITAKLAALTGKTLVFEGNAAFIAAADRAKFDFYILDASAYTAHYELSGGFDYLVDFLEIPAAKIIPAVKLSGIIADRSGTGRQATVMAAQEALTRPLAGVAVTDISTDYYSAAMTYPRTRNLINYLNPAQKP